MDLEKYKNKICKVGNILREEIINYSTVKKKHKNGNWLGIDGIQLSNRGHIALDKRKIFW